MNKIFCLLCVLLIVSCASEEKKFNPSKTCATESIKYITQSQNSSKRYINSPYLIEKLSNTKRSMQLCYEDFKNRSGYDDDFNTCLVVGIDEHGVMDFYEFSSKEVKLDEAFIKCANSVTASVDFSSYGWNYILVQTYKFYEE